MLTVVVPVQSKEPPLPLTPGAAGVACQWEWVGGVTRLRTRSPWRAPGTLLELGKEHCHGWDVLKAELGVGVGK